MNTVRIMSMLVTLTLLFSFANLSPTAAHTQAACASSGSPTVWTDKADYGPFETVTISGSGFGCGEVLSVLVTAPDGSTRSSDGMGSAGPDLVTTDGNGAFVLSYRLSGTLPDGSTYMGQEGEYTVKVLNASGAVLASTTFSDSLGGYHSCALTVGGGVKCWGYNEYGQLGDGSTTNRHIPVDVSGLTSGVAQISAGPYHTCAVTTGGGAKCWGWNDFGQLGDGSTITRTTPVDVSGLISSVAQISAGRDHTCAVTTSGGAKCWGRNLVGELGDGSTISRTTPVDVSGLTSSVAQISAGNSHTCALTVGGGAKCWGLNFAGQLGDGSTISRTTPVDVSGLPSGVAWINTGRIHTCAVTTGGGIKCWGYNFYGQLGDGTTVTRTMPVDVSGLTSGVAQISAGDGFTCAVTAGGGAKCWGRNTYGQLGDGTTITRTTPVDVSGLTSGVAQIGAGWEHTCALTTGGGVKCWGIGDRGQLGNGTTISHTTPVDVSGLTAASALCRTASLCLLTPPRRSSRPTLVARSATTAGMSAMSASRGASPTLSRSSPHRPAATPPRSTPTRLARR